MDKNDIENINNDIMIYNKNKINGDDSSIVCHKMSCSIPKSVIFANKFYFQNPKNYSKLLQ